MPYYSGGNNRTTFFAASKVYALKTRTGMKLSSNLANDHLRDDVSSMHVDGDQGTQNSTSELTEFTADQCRQLVEILHTMHTAPLSLLSPVGHRTPQPA